MLAGPSPGEAVQLIDYLDSDFVEVEWLRRLLGKPVYIVRDGSQTKTFRNSVVICKRLGKLNTDLLKRIAATPGVVLYHISDEWYLEPLENYRCFAHVIRHYYHTGLDGSFVSQMPLGPAYSSQEQKSGPPAPERKYVWSFAGQLVSTRRLLVKKLECLVPHHVHLTGGVRNPLEWLGPDEYLDLLTDSIFVPCAMGNVNLESFRIYEALDCGAIPVVERRPWLDYFTRLFGQHPLLSVSNWEEAPPLMLRLLADSARLQAKQDQVREWWAGLQRRFSERLVSVLRGAQGREDRPLAGLALPGRLRGAMEMLRHHNRKALQARALLTIKRATRVAG